ncbi:MAG: hypothetical protein LBI02_02535, partial [Opitutaceae bacterium]|nr:hypothetical protein [Opitutaceae bacterium]
MIPGEYHVKRAPISERTGAFARGRAGFVLRAARFAGVLVRAVAKKRCFNDHPFRYHEEIVLEVHTLTNRGAGLGRVALPQEAGAAAGGG